MKRIISCLLSLVIVFSAFGIVPISVEAAQPKLTVSSAKADAGKTVTVEVGLKNNPGIVSACVNVAFDDGLTLTDAKNGDAFPSSIQFIKPKQLSNGGKINGNCNFVWSGADIKEKDIKDGIILTLTFSVSAEAKKGQTYNIRITSRKGDIVDKNLSTVEFESVTGTVRVVNGASDTNIETNNKSFRTLFDWLRRLIMRIKEILSKNVNA